MEDINLKTVFSKLFHHVSVNKKHVYNYVYTDVVENLAKSLVYFKFVKLIFTRITGKYLISKVRLRTLFVSYNQ